MHNSLWLGFIIINLHLCKVSCSPGKRFTIQLLFESICCKKSKLPFLGFHLLSCPAMPKRPNCTKYALFFKRPATIFHLCILGNNPLFSTKLASLVAQTVKNFPAMQENWVKVLGREDPLEEEMATHSSILAWRIPWTEEPGGLQSMGSPRVRHD